MPVHTTWFRFLPFYEEVMAFLYSLPLPEWAPAERSWIDGVEHYGGEHMFHALLVLLILTGVALMVRGKLTDVKAALVPDPRMSLRTFTELVTEMTLSLMKDMMKPEDARYFLPLIGTCAFFILFSNLLGLVPGFSPPTSVLNTTVACALIVFVTTHIYGVKAHGPKYILHFFGPVVPTKYTPVYAIPFILILMSLMFLIETISHLARPLSLSMRLMGNMFADHTVVSVFTGLIVIMPVIVPLPVMLLGVFVCFVQTLVFCLLSIIYISSAIEHAEEH
jgi:F-type H+-transporting ATPase subunit a